MIWMILSSLLITFMGLYTKVNADYKQINGDKEWIKHGKGVVVAWPYNLLSGALLFASNSKHWMQRIHLYDSIAMKILLSIVGLAMGILLARSIWWIFFDWWLNSKRGLPITYTGTHDNKKDAWSDELLALMPPCARIPFKVLVMLAFTFFLYI